MMEAQPSAVTAKGSTPKTHSQKAGMDCEPHPQSKTQVAVDRAIANYAAQLPLPKLPKILLVEDNPVNQKVLLTQLKHLGYHPALATDGQAALQLMTHTHYDIVLMDCQMPVLDGYDTTREIRRREVNTRHTIIIALTANALKEDRDQCIKAGMDDYLSKPVLKEQLAAKLNAWSQLIASPPAESSPSPCLPLFIDWHQLAQVCDGSPEFESELLQMFAEDIQLRFQMIETAIADHNPQLLEQAAHQIKGSSANLGLTAFQAVADVLEQQARQQQMRNARDRLTELQALYRSLQSYLTQKAKDIGAVIG